MAIIFVLMALPELILASTDVYLYGELKESKKYPYLELDMSEPQIYVYKRSIITNTERNTFNLSDNNLKNAVKSLFGKQPDFVYLNSPTPGAHHYDLYNYLHWDQVTRTIRFLRYNISKFSTEPAVMHRQILRNTYAMPTTFTTNISMEVQDRISSSWSTGGELSLKKNITYGIKMVFVDFNSEISFYYSSPWAKNHEQSQNMILRVNRGVVLEPGQSAVFEIIATKRTIQFELEYEVYLLGDVAASYDECYKRKLHKRFHIKECMDTLGISNILPFREVIDFKFYADSSINVYDQQNGTVLMQAVDWINKI